MEWAFYLTSAGDVGPEHSVEFRIESSGDRRRVMQLRQTNLAKTGRGKTYNLESTALSMGPWFPIGLYDAEHTYARNVGWL